MKVTFCSFDGPNCINGPNAWLRRLVPELQSRGIQTQIIFTTSVPEQECTTLPLLRQAGIECMVIPLLPCYTEYRVRWIIEKLAQEPPDVFVPNMIVPALYAGRWVREAGIPTIGVLHSDDEEHRGIISEFVLGPAYQLSGIVCVSQELEQQLQQHPPRTVVRRLPYGAPIPERVASVPNQKLRITYVGRLVEEQKRISEVTRALCRAVREVPETEAVIYGSGPDRITVEQILQAEGSGLPICLAGRVDSEQMQQRLLNCHVIVLLSDYEGLPVALMEAMACGVVPVCLSIRSGIPELVEDGVTGLLVGDRGDDFVAAIKRLRQESGLWHQLSQQARAKIQTEYSHQACAMRWEQFLTELHQSAGSRRSIKVPFQLNLPPVHPGLARSDYRTPPIHTRVWQKSQRIAGQIKGKLLSGSF